MAKLKLEPHDVDTIKTALAIAYKHVDQTSPSCAAMEASDYLQVFRKLMPHGTKRRTSIENAS